LKEIRNKISFEFVEYGHFIDFVITFGLGFLRRTSKKGQFKVGGFFGYHNYRSKLLPWLFTNCLDHLVFSLEK
jgi:hypothetical protein